MALVYSYSPSLSGYSVVSSAAGGGPASCEGSSPIIPEYYNGPSGNLPVVRIGINAFSSCQDIETITLPTGIRIIANNAFGGSSIKNINIPDSVNSIGGGAFSICSQLTSVRLSNNLISLPSNLFVACGSLKSINIPDSITGIADSVFAECFSLENVVLGKNLKSLGNGCFAECSNLKNLYFKGDLPATGNSIFALLNPNQIKINIKKYFVTGWGSSFGSMPVVLWSDNVIKSGGTGKLLTTKKYIRRFEISNSSIQDLNGVYTRNSEFAYFENENNEYLISYNTSLSRWEIFLVGSSSLLIHYHSTDLINWTKRPGSRVPDWDSNAIVTISYTL